MCLIPNSWRLVQCDMGLSEGVRCLALSQVRFGFFRPQPLYLHRTEVGDGNEHSDKMIDTVSAERRSEIMSRIRGKDTQPEMRVRRMVHAMGYRYRLHRKDLPGRPDMTFPRLGKIIMVHGCFWHQHDDPDCPANRRPKSNRDYWNAKLDRNIVRDAENYSALRERGWEVLVVWECQLKDSAALAARLQAFLSSPPPP